MLDASLEYKSDDAAAYNVRLKYDAQWSTAKKKVLIILQTVDSRDLSKRELLGDKATKTLMVNCIKEARGFVRAYNEEAVNGLAFAVVNYNAKKHLHLSTQAKREAEKEFAARAHKLIKKMKPTHVLVGGDDAMKSMFPQVLHSNYKRGWVHKLKSGDQNVLVTSTLDMARLVEKGGLHANLLGFWYRHLGHLILGKHPQDLSHIKVEPRYVDTLDKFDQLMAVLKKAKIVAIDTETANLTVLHNSIYTIQFATDVNELVGYVLPINHPMGPFDGPEIKYIRTVLRAYFSTQEGEAKTVVVKRPKAKGNLTKYAETSVQLQAPEQSVFFNGQFDLRVIRRELKLPIVWHRVWEIQAGDHLLDENIAELSLTTGTKAGNLRAFYCSYGNDAYLLASGFTKEDRATTGNVSPSNKDFLLYAATDVVCLLAMRKAQIHRAAHEDYLGKNYKPTFIRHMLYQMSDTVHQLSHLREDGSLIDKEYLKSLMGPDSPLKKELRIAGRALKEYKEVQAANSSLLKASGLKSKGLFGAVSKATNWMFRIKTAHLKVLFYEIMGLEALSQTSTGEDAVDKAFIEAYKDKHAVVSTYADYNMIQKLLSTYVRGWYKKISSNSDSLTDGHLRPDYTFWDVVTGRLASKNPSLQTIPQRSKLAKIIKRMFIAPKGYLLVRFDYSAHEVRMWSVVSFDKILADVFRMGQKLRQAFIKNPSEENKKAIKERGDVHILNVKRLFNKMVDKSHPLRDAVKAVVFGLLYGKSAQTLGVDTKKGEIDELKGKIRALKAELKAIKLKEAEK